MSDSPDPIQDDNEIVALVLLGEIERFRLLVERYEQRTLNMIYRFTWDQSRCEEIGQEIFIAAFRNLKSFDPSRSKFSTWLFTITRNKSINALKRPVSTSLEQQPELLEPRTPLNDLTDKELFRHLDCSLRALPEQLQRAFILLEFEQLSYEEVAQIERVPIGTIKSRANRARAKLQEIMNKFEAEKP